MMVGGGIHQGKEVIVRRLGLVLASFLLVASGCGGSGGSPVDIAKSYMDAYTRHDTNAMIQLSCSQMVPLIEGGGIFLRYGSPGSTFENPTYDLLTQRGSTATVRMTATLHDSGGGILPPTTRPFSTTLNLTDEEGWKVCG